jgi:predicted phage baseplate assembly protein
VAATNEVLTVQVDNAGDFSMYTFRLVVSPTDMEPPADFDAQLAFVEFSFKAGCPSDFDCKAKDNCRDEVPSKPRIDYLAKDYASFRQLMLDRLSLLTPNWRERNAADLQIALVELLAYTGDYLSYYQDAVATEAYLYKARKRISARRHARLLDYPVHDGCNARTWVTLEVESGSSSDGANLPASTVFMTRGSSNEVSVPQTSLEEKLREKGLIVFESIEQITLHASQNKIEFYTWDDTSCCLPRGATKATLYSASQQDLFLQQGQILVLEEVFGPTTGLPADADPTHRHAVRLSRVVKDRHFEWG